MAPRVTSRLFAAPIFSVVMRGVLTRWRAEKVQAVPAVHAEVGEVEEVLLAGGVGEPLEEAVGHPAVGGEVGGSRDREGGGQGGRVQADAEDAGAGDEDQAWVAVYWMTWWRQARRPPSVPTVVTVPSSCSYLTGTVSVAPLAWESKSDCPQWSAWSAAARVIGRRRRRRLRRGGS
ncbi:hypothetical protein ACFWG0_27745 [Streptomyces yangpuensis]|uniref:hypothetical protein n=1 Tax=Streptomyces yangpuensis TaxID=1648182 RepID=UPI00364A6883